MGIRTNSINGNKSASNKAFEYGKADPLPVMEHFYTLQGEGNWAGTPSYFIRLAGCDVGCHWCDVKDSWSVSEKQEAPVSKIISWVKQTPAKRVVITGGEPSIYNLEKLCSELHQEGLLIHLETAGVHPLKGDFDWICFSPKKFVAPLPEFYQLAHELKVIVFNSHDLEWAEKHAALCGENVQLFLQAEWEQRHKMSPLILDHIKQNPAWRISLQTHKYLDIP